MKRRNPSIGEIAYDSYWGVELKKPWTELSEEARAMWTRVGHAGPGAVSRTTPLQEFMERFIDPESDRYKRWKARQAESQAPPPS